MQQVVYEGSGGTVTKVAPRRFIVNAPDGRDVGHFSIRKQAIEKAQNWDKWDAFNSLTEIYSIIAPFTFLLTTQSLLTITDKEPFIPTEEQMIIAAVFDCLIMLGGQHPEILEKLRNNPELVKEIVDKIKTGMRGKLKSA